MIAGLIFFMFLMIMIGFTVNILHNIRNGKNGNIIFKKSFKYIILTFLIIGLMTLWSDNNALRYKLESEEQIRQQESYKDPEFLKLPEVIPRRQVKYPLKKESLLVKSRPLWNSCPPPTSNNSLWSLATDEGFVRGAVVMAHSIREQLHVLSYPYI